MVICGQHKHLLPRRLGVHFSINFGSFNSKIIFILLSLLGTNSCHTVVAGTVCILEELRALRIDATMPQLWKLGLENSTSPNPFPL
jgi:hypothetical protein